MRDYKLYLYDIKEAIDKVESFTEGLTSEYIRRALDTANTRYFIPFFCSAVAISLSLLELTSVFRAVN